MLPCIKPWVALLSKHMRQSPLSSILLPVAAATAAAAAAVDGPGTPAAAAAVGGGLCWATARRDGLAFNGFIKDDGAGAVGLIEADTPEAPKLN